MILLLASFSPTLFPFSLLLSLFSLCLLFNLLSLILQPAPVSKAGAYYFSCDKPEMLMDFIKDASTSAGVTLKDDVLAILDVGGEAMYDEV